MKEDLRVQKTKAALFRAFYELLAEKSYESITVNELCEKAMVRRATFYKHYRDKHDFLVGIVKRFRENFHQMITDENERISLADYFVKYISKTINHVISHQDIVKNILDSQMREPFINVVLQINYDDAIEHIKIGESMGLSLSISTEVAASMLVGGTSILIIKWFEGGMVIPREKLEADIKAVIMRILEVEKV